MSRLEKKCLFASLALHSLLAVILLVGPAFLSSRRKVTDLPVLQVIPSKLVDAALFGGGNPNAKSPPEQKVERPSPQQPRQPDPVPPQPRPDPEPPKIKIAETTVKPAPSKPPIKVGQKITVRQPDDKKPSNETKERTESKNNAREQTLARQQTATRIDKLFNGVTRNLDKNLSSGTTVEMPGPGGEAYANYAQAVKSIYDRAWIDPEEVVNDDATVQVKVVISRDGTVISDAIIRRSGIPALDKSVQSALDRVSYIAPFPEGAKESQRTFTITFSLKAKRLIG